MKLHILCGIPGCGKSYLVSKLQGYVVSTDQIRKFLWNNESYLKHDKFVFKIADLMMRFMLSRKEDVILDSTNITIRKRKKYIRLAQKYEAEVIVHWIDCPLSTAIRQNAQRERQVPVEVIESMHQTLQPPTMAEGMDSIKIYHPEQILD